VTFDPSKVAKAWSVLVEPGDVAEVRAFEADGTTYGGYFTSAEALAAAVPSIERRTKGVYITLNPVDPALLARSPEKLTKRPASLTKDDNITRRRWLLLDFDPIRPKGLAGESTTEAEKAAAEAVADDAYDWLRAEGWPEPIKASSGNGWHLLYRIDLPANDGGLVKRVLETLSARFSDDTVDVDTTVANASRICKLYGTTPRKGSGEGDRPHRMACITVLPESMAVVTREKLEALAPAVAPLPPMPKPSAPHGDVGDIERRAVEYLERIPPAIQGECGSNPTLWAARVAVYGFDLPKETAFRLLSEIYNPKCEPPWSGPELWRKVNEADRLPFKHPRGWLRDKERPRSETFTERASRAEVSVSEPDEYDVADLCEQFPHMLEPVVEGLLRRGEILNVVGGSKSQKSWLIADLAIAVALGRPWLGFPTVQGRVLLVDNELHKNTLADRLRRVASARAVTMADLRGRFTVRPLRGKLVDIFNMEPQFDRYEPGDYRLMLLDAWYRLLPTTENAENSNSIVTGAYNALDRIAMRMDSAIGVVHHASKGNQSAKSITDMGAGGGAQSRATDTHLVLRPHKEEGCVVLEAELRSFRKIEPRVLRWTFPTWTVEPDLDPADLLEPGKRRSAEKALDVAGFVAKYVSPFPREQTAIVKQAHDDGMPKAQAKDMLKAAKDQQRIYPSGGSGRTPLSYSTTPFVGVGQ
jgi:hypothetical protein